MVYELHNDDGTTAFAVDAPQARHISRVFAIVATLRSESEAS